MVDDVVGEVFATASRLRAQLPDDDVRMWWFRTAWHVLLHRFRSARRRERWGARSAREAVVGGPATARPADAPRCRACVRATRNCRGLTSWEQVTTEQVAEVGGGTPPARCGVGAGRCRRRESVRVF